MATSNNSKNQQVPPQVDKPTGPPIEYIGEGADKVKFTNGSVEAIEAIAELMPKLNANPPPKNNFRPDSSETTGGTPKSVTQIQQDYIKGKINTVQYSDKMKALGKSP